MILGDLLLEQSVADDELRTAIAHALDLDAAHVSLTSSIEDTSSSTGATVERGEIGGQFFLQLTIYTSDDDGAALIDVAAKVSRYLALRVLIASESSNPYAMTLIEPSGARTEVNVDTERLDELGHYNLVG